MQCVLRRLTRLPCHSRAMCSGERTVQLQVSPQRCLFDEPLKIQARGLVPGQYIVLRTELTDDGGEVFTSLGSYRAGSSGELELSRTPALKGGSFTGIETDGPLWALEPQNPLRRLLKRNVQSPFQLRFCLHQEDSQGVILASATQERSFMGDGVIRVPVCEGPVRATLFLPPGSGPFPGIIDLYGTGGGLMEHRASLLASHGFVTMALAYFGYDDLPKNLDVLRLDYFGKALEFLKQHPKVDKHGIGIIGLSKGADLAITMATFLPGIKAVVSVSGCNANAFAPLICDGFVLPALGFGAERITFTDAGEMDFSRAMDDPLDPAYQDCLIPAERSTAAFLILSGLDDKNWPSAIYSKQLVARLKQHDKNVECHYYPGAGHLLEPPYLPLCKASHHKLIGMPVLWGGQLREHAKAQDDAWKRIKMFFLKHLKNVPAHSQL
ncbi:acyl-coenzyme A thioesterase 5-like [Gastrophryne carolinensis]